MGIRTPVSTNSAMTLGGLKQGVTPLDMAHAYETFARGGKRDRGHAGRAHGGPVGIHRRCATGDKPEDRRNNVASSERACSPSSVADDRDAASSSGVVRIGTGKAAPIPDEDASAGKTGTTENYGDAWFVGFNDD